MYEIKYSKSILKIQKLFRILYYLSMTMCKKKSKKYLIFFYRKVANCAHSCAKQLIKSRKIDAFEHYKFMWTNDAKKKKKEIIIIYFIYYSIQSTHMNVWNVLTCTILTIYYTIVINSNTNIIKRNFDKNKKKKPFFS